MSWHGISGRGERVHIAEQVWQPITGSDIRGMSLCRRALVTIEQLPETQHPLELKAGDNRPICQDCRLIAERKPRGRAITMRPTSREAVPAG